MAAGFPEYRGKRALASQPIFSKGLPVVVRWSLAQTETCPRISLNKRVSSSLRSQKRTQNVCPGPVQWPWQQHTTGLTGREERAMIE